VSSQVKKISLLFINLYNKISKVSMFYLSLKWIFYISVGEKELMMILRKLERNHPKDTISGNQERSYLYQTIYNPTL
jgi:hypothetical protein